MTLTAGTGSLGERVCAILLVGLGRAANARVSRLHGPSGDWLTQRDRIALRTARLLMKRRFGYRLTIVAAALSMVLTVGLPPASAQNPERAKALVNTWL